MTIWERLDRGLQREDPAAYNNLNDVLDGILERSFTSDSSATRILVAIFIGCVLVLACFTLLIFIAQRYRLLTQESQLIKRQRDLIGAIAHELKTPMGVVMLLSEKVLSEKKAADKDRRAKELITETECMNQRLMDIFNLYRLDSGQLQLQTQEISLREAVMDVAEGYEPLVEDKNLQIRIAEGDTNINVDSYWFRFAISNLLSNAIKFCTEGGCVEIVWETGKRRNTISVFNTGSHIPEKDIKRIWDLFYTKSNGDNAKKGSGLGLSIVKSIAALHGGSCGCQNVQGGVEFWFQVKERRRG